MGERMTDYQFRQLNSRLAEIRNELRKLNKTMTERNANSATIVLGEIKPPKQPIDPMGYTE